MNWTIEKIIKWTNKYPTFAGDVLRKNNREVSDNELVNVLNLMYLFDFQNKIVSQDSKILNTEQFENAFLKGEDMSDMIKDSSYLSMLPNETISEINKYLTVEEGENLQQAYPGFTILNENRERMARARNTFRDMGYNWMANSKYLDTINLEELINELSDLGQNQYMLEDENFPGLRDQIVISFLIRGNKKEIIKLILKEGLDGNIDGSFMFAAGYDMFEIVTILINAGANIDSVNRQGFSSLMYAAMDGHVEMVDFLINAGANVNLATMHGRTALILAATSNKNVEVAQLLVNAGANLDMVDDEGATALIRAAMDKNVEVAELLIDAGADISIVDRRGKDANDYL